ncbi:hypothetical protein FJZ28_02955 [Candidatus Peregrinibacteria bacterium]|nr:hypothetical protein [Candidatus Peregrinibacteria bacterium]
MRKIGYDSSEDMPTLPVQYDGNTEDLKTGDTFSLEMIESDGTSHEIGHVILGEKISEGKGSRSRASTPNYRANYDAIFGNKNTRN